MHRGANEKVGLGWRAIEFLRRRAVSICQQEGRGRLWFLGRGCGHAVGAKPADIHQAGGLLGGLRLRVSATVDSVKGLLQRNRLL